MKKLIVLTMLLSGCATYKATLTNDKGEKMTCEASGKNGIITGHYLKKGFNECIENAKAQGFKEAGK